MNKIDSFLYSFNQCTFIFKQLQDIFYLKNGEINQHSGDLGHVFLVLGLDVFLNHGEQQFSENCSLYFLGFLGKDFFIFLYLFIGTEFLCRFHLWLRGNLLDSAHHIIIFGVLDDWLLDWHVFHHIASSLGVSSVWLHHHHIWWHSHELALHSLRSLHHLLRRHTHREIHLHVHVHWHLSSVRLLHHHLRHVIHGALVHDFVSFKIVILVKLAF